jgi:hypothetical protein
LQAIDVARTRPPARWMACVLPSDGGLHADRRAAGGVGLDRADCLPPRVLFAPSARDAAPPPRARAYATARAQPANESAAGATNEKLPSAVAALLLPSVRPLGASSELASAGTCLRGKGIAYRRQVGRSLGRRGTRPPSHRAGYRLRGEALVRRQQRPRALRRRCGRSPELLAQRCVSGVEVTTNLWTRHR